MRTSTIKKMTISISLSVLIFLIVILLLSYFLFARRENLDDVKKGLVLVEYADIYKISYVGNDSIVFSSFDSIPVLADDGPVIKRYATGFFVSDSVVATSANRFVLTSDMTDSIVCSRLDIFCKKASKQLKTIGSQIKELTYFVNTHDSLDEGYGKACAYKTALKHKADHIKGIVRIIKENKEKGSCPVLSKSTEASVFLQGRNEPVEANVNVVDKIAFVNLHASKSPYVFSKSLFQVRRWLQYKFYCIMAVTERICSFDGQWTPMTGNAEITRRSSYVPNFPMKDGAVLLDNNLRYLGMYSEGKYITSNKIAYELSKFVSEK